MKLTNLYIQNFLSIRQVELQLDSRGITLVLGENLDNPDFDNNGAGKSTLTEALTYVLYGKTIRGLKGDEVVNRISKKNCKVTLDIEDDDGVVYRVSRYRKHADNGNKFFLFRGTRDITPKSESDFTKAIVDLLNMDYLTFTSSILYSAQSFKFTSATDAELKSAFDTMLGLDLYTKCLEETKSQIKEIDYDIRLYTEDKRSKMSQVEESEESLSEYNAMYKEREASFKSEMTDLLEHQKETQDNIETLLKLIEKNSSIVEESQEKVNQKSSDIKDNLDKIRSDIKKIELSIGYCNEDIQNNNNKVNKLKTSIEQNNSEKRFNNKIAKNLEQRIQKHNENLDESEKLVGTRCTNCGNIITDISDAVSKIKEELEEDTKELSACYASNGLVDEKNNKLLDKLKLVEEDTMEAYSDKETLEKAVRLKYKKLQSDKGVLELDKLKDQLHEDKLRLSNSKSDHKHNVSLLEDIAKSINKLNTEENPYTKLIQDSNNKIKELNDSISKIESSLSLLYTDKEELQFWLGGFSNSGIKSLLLDDITPMLNERSNRYLKKLSSDRMEITFSTQDTLKNGEKRDKFNIKVNNTDGGDSYMSNSSGEKRRVDIAVNLALQDLISSRSSKKLNLVVYDEVLDALDGQGVENAVSLLHDISKNKSSVFVITHNDDIKSMFTNYIKITKKGGYSTLTER